MYKREILIDTGLLVVQIILTLTIAHADFARGALPARRQRDASFTTMRISSHRR